MRKRIDAMKKELVTDNSYRDIHKRGFIYESPDNGKTIYRRPSSYCDVSGVKIDGPEQTEDDVNERTEKNLDEQLPKRIILAKISQIYILIGEITEEVKKLRDNN
jgi:hypothetical protein